MMMRINKNVIYGIANRIDACYLRKELSISWNKKNNWNNDLVVRKWLNLANSSTKSRLLVRLILDDYLWN